ncbi:unnamed protein product [Camellia sinensis]
MLSSVGRESVEWCSNGEATRRLSRTEADCDSGGSDFGYRRVARVLCCWLHVGEPNFEVAKGEERQVGQGDKGGKKSAVSRMGCEAIGWAVEKPVREPSAGKAGFDLFDSGKKKICEHSRSSSRLALPWA